MLFKLHDVVKISLNLGYALYVKVVPHRHALGFTALVDEKGLSVNLEVLNSYDSTEIVCTVLDPAYQRLMKELEATREIQLKLWQHFGAQGWNNHEDIMHERRAPLN